MPRLSERIRDILVCPHCHERLTPGSDDRAECPACPATYGSDASGALDLRLQTPKFTQLRFELGTHLPETERLAFAPLTANPQPEVDFGGVVAPRHISQVLLSHFPRATHPGSLALDLGCGDAVHRGLCEHAGFEYVGLDFDTPGAPIFADGHALPFADESFDFVLSIAVLEHIRYPFVMMAEAHRVLRPGGRLIGTVAFLEPFHQHSYYHHTHLGTLNSLQHAGFHVDVIAPDVQWNGLRAQAMMAMFPKLDSRIALAAVAPVGLAQRAWLGLRKAKSRSFDENITVLRTTGAFTFLARRE